MMIGLSKFIALSMPMVDLVMLSWWGSGVALADYAMTTQLVQVFVVLSLALSIGVPIYFNQHSDGVLATRQAIGYACLIGIALLALSWLYFVGLDAVHAFSPQQTLVYVLLIGGVLSLPCYIVLNHILDALGKSRQVIYLTAIMTVLNIALNYQLLFNSSLSAQAAIATATTAVRIIGLLVLMAWIGQQLGTHALRATLHPPAIKKLLDFGQSELLTGLVFTLGFALLSFYLNARFDAKLVGEFGIFLNMINLSFVVYVGFASALVIYLSKLPNQPIKLHRTTNRQIDWLIIRFVAGSLLAGAVLSPLLCWLYFGQFDTKQLLIVLAALLVAAIDGLAIATIAKLRVAGDTKKPPLFRLLLVVVGLPLGGWLLSMAGLFGVGIAFIIANACSVIALKVYQKRLLL
ncbi:hypothetical protein [Moraxella cuniculi]|nr:hypothetical protein [Moraxella cuniculi]OOS06023.1 hypothetical protein B0189_06090 [Moraxella cuniculi]